ncbi:MAG: PfkB family carbohydrate kinase, partial [Actinomycetota bacterium]|nr:PfkB family carbohydrate kinase [Actinomycetota bacterium]
MGRVGVDLYPQQSGVPLSEVRTFAKSLGGSATNVAVAAARLGHASAVITKVGRDGFGTYVRQALERFGVDIRWVGTDPELRTPVVFVELYPPDHFPILFYREPKAPDMNLRLAELDLGAIRRAPIFWTTGTGLSDEPSRTATLGALEERSRRPATVHDLDYRPALWP